MRFEVLATDGAGRRGRLTTAHGVVETPAFMPVGTRGTVKALGPDDLIAAGAQIVLANTYHLLLKPGHELIRDLGGLHVFMGWDGPILTDSGGFQVFSLSKIRTLSEDGVEFRSPIDGSTHVLTPERSIEIQHALGADIIHPLDECLAYPAAREATERSLALTLRWARRSQAAHAASASAAALFGIVQGGAWEDLREQAVAETVALGFDGYAIGGMAVGEPKALMYGLTAAIEDLIEAVSQGVDLFDCVLPTRNARNGQCFTPDGPLVIKHAAYARDARSLQDDCGCYACRRFSRAYLRHLFVSDELLAFRLLSLHNIHFFLGLMADLRSAIAEGRLAPFKTRFFERYPVRSVVVSLDSESRTEV